MQSQSSQIVSGIYPIHKERGETLAVLLERFRREYSIGDDIKLTYAGRLDPMAEGIVLVLAGESRFEKDALLGLPKTYEVDVILGIATDTQDTLGFITATADKEIDEASVRTVLDAMQSIVSLPYPLYSSVPVAGKPLFVHARAGTPVVVPIKKVTIHSTVLVSITKERLADVAASVIVDIQKVVGDFRQEATITQWREFVTSDKDVVVVRVRIDASSGTYMRSLAAWMGQELGVPALAYRIKRIRIGEYTNK